MQKTSTILLFQFNIVAMSFVPLDRVDFSKDDSLQATPVRIRAMGRCKSPVPASEHSVEATPSRSHLPNLNGSRVQPTPSQQPSIPRHRRSVDDQLLRTLNESVSELRDEIHNKSASRDSFATERIADLCRKLDVIASVVLRHERELKSQSSIVEQLSVPKPRDETSQLMSSILAKVNEVNSLMASAQHPARPASVHPRFEETASVAPELAEPLYRIAEALDSVTKEVQRQHVTIERLAKAQQDREEDERIAAIMAVRPPSNIADSTASTEDPHRAFVNRMSRAAQEFDSVPRSREVRTPSYHTESRGNSVILPNEESPRRARHAFVALGDAGDASADELTLPEGDLDPSPARARTYDAEVEFEEASPRRVRNAGVVLEGSTVAAKTVFDDRSAVRTATKQPAYLLQAASAKKLSARKPVNRADIFESSLDTSAGSPNRLDETRSDSGRQDALIQQLLRENESLKDQLYRQLQKCDDLRSVAEGSASTPAGRGRSMFASAY